MKAILKVKRGSAYSKYNGYTFDISELADNQITLLIPSNVFNTGFVSTDFKFNEVIINDINTELLNAYVKFSNGSDYATYPNLKKYCDINKIKY